MGAPLDSIELLRQAFHLLALAPLGFWLGTWSEFIQPVYKIDTESPQEHESEQDQKPAWLWNRTHHTGDPKRDRQIPPTAQTIEAVQQHLSEDLISIADDHGDGIESRDGLMRLSGTRTPNPRSKATGLPTKEIGPYSGPGEEQLDVPHEGDKLDWMRLITVAFVAYASENNTVPSHLCLRLASSRASPLTS